MENVANKRYKDKLFRLVFREKDKLLSLYNAVNKTNYTNPDDLEIITLENAIYMNMKNDLAFLIDDWLNLYEHQSTVNPNMPLRDLIYVAKEYQKLTTDKSLYSSVLIKLPTPRFIVFYNGTREQPEEQVLKLSDAYEKITEEVELELKVTVLNVNLGCNAELMEACQTLKEYAYYVERVRKYIKEMALEQAVDRAMDECIKENILREFLIKYRAEAKAVCIFEYDEEYEIAKIKKMEREDEREIVLREIEKIKKMEREDEREIVLREIEKIKKMEREDEREIVLREIEKIKKMEREDEREILLRDIEKIKKMEREDERRIALKEGEEMALIKQVYKKVMKNKSLERIADELEQELEVIKPIYEIVKEMKNDFDCNAVYEKINA